MTTFTFYHDPGHGWLAVTWDTLRDLGLTPQDFSRYSYRGSSGAVFYLEEDLDAPKFLAVWKAEHGIEPNVEEVYQEKTFIRDLPSIW